MEGRHAQSKQGGTLYIFMGSFILSSHRDSPHLNTCNFACTAWELLGLFCHRNWTFLTKHDNLAFLSRWRGILFCRGFVPCRPWEMRSCQVLAREMEEPSSSSGSQGACCPSCPPTPQSLGRPLDRSQGLLCFLFIIPRFFKVLDFISLFIWL